MNKFKQVKAVFSGVLLAFTFIPVAMADDTEIYTTPPGGQYPETKPNIMFVIDASIDMLSTSTVKPPYDPDTEYDGPCNSDFIYFSQDGSLPSCANNSTDYFNPDALVCQRALKKEQYVLDANGLPTQEVEVVDGALLTVGKYVDRFAQNAPSGNAGNARPVWRNISVTRSAHRDYIVECLSDNGIHGETDDSANKYIINGNAKYDNVPAINPVYEESSSIATLFHPNYINYRLDANVVADEEISYVDQIKGAIKNMVEGNTQVNIGMLILDQDGSAQGDPGSEGGGIIYQMQDGALPRGNFIPQLLAINAEGSTPLSEAYYEALLYYGGKAVDYGTDANPPLVGSATTPSNSDYISPILLSCQKNYIVVASNGKATHDDINETRQNSLAADGFARGQCSTDITPTFQADDNRDADNSDGSTVDNCLDELAYWAKNNDVAKLPVPAHEGEQTITTHTVGFGYSRDGDGNLDPDQVAGKQLLEDTADKGEGDFYEADSQEELEAAFEAIILDALKVNSTFSSPAVSVNAFNRSTHLDNLYYTLFKPTDGNHWEGNLKKYKLEFAVDSTDKDGDGDTTEILPFIADQLGNEAIDPGTGFFSDTAISYWSSAVDGKEVADGGAASRLSTTRNVYTYTGTYNISGGVSTPAAGSGDLSTVAANEVDPNNAALTEALLGIVGYAELVPGTSYRETLINWASGLDALSNFGAVDTYGDVRPQMGDPLHSEPALVQYGETTVNGETVADMVSYTATNDGYLHAFDIITGNELFAFIPQELLPKLQIAMEDKGGDKLYGLDGNVIAWVNDVNHDGTISAGDGDHVYIYVSMRRGGRNIYALDVTTRTAPELLWVIKGGTGDYTELGQTWSSVNVEILKDGTTEKTVLIFGGGYDTLQDSVTVTTEDTMGRTVYIADATTGARLWTADAHDGVTVPTVAMNFSIPARVKPLDISGDGYIDRLYVVDMGGQVFRFDIDNTNDQALSNSIIGGVFADLADASKAMANRTEENARRFYYPPDVALIDAREGAYESVVLSSGYRAHPLNTTIQDRIYMLKDKRTSAITDPADYVTLTEDDLFNATTNTAGGDAGSDAVREVALTDIASADGWYIYLDDEDNPGSWIGEKGLAEPLILAGNAIVTTYTPVYSPDSTSCLPTIGYGKVYFLDIQDATASFPSSLDARSDRHIKLSRSGIPPTPNVIITDDGVPTLCIGTECGEAEFGLGLRKTYWYEVK